MDPVLRHLETLRKTTYRFKNPIVGYYTLISFTPVRKSKPINNILTHLPTHLLPTDILICGIGPGTVPDLLLNVSQLSVNYS